MPTQRLTQCPHCKASFKVSEEQLSAANGRVRCGSCMNIFDAIAYSISEVKDAQPSDQPTPIQPHSSESPLVDLEDSILGKTSKDETLFQDDPNEDKKESGYAGSSTITDDLSTSFLELDESSDDENNSPYITSVQEVDLIETNTEDESWTDEILEGVDTDNVDKIEPHISNISSNEKSSLEVNASPQSNDSSIHSTENKEDNYDSLNFYYQQDKKSLGRHWLVSSVFLILIITLTVTLLAQASWLHYEKLSQYPQTAALYKKACALLKCQLPILSDIQKIKSHNLIVRSHPTTPKALIIDAIIINDATFGQGFPNIALYFSDINNRTIAQRLIRPEEYLSAEILQWPNMPSEQPIHISLEIIDPGKEAVNYALKFFMAKSQKTTFKQ